MQNRRRVSEKSRLIALLLAIFVGVFGAHRFYVGRVASGILYLCTEGLFGFGVIVDIIIIATGTFYDCYGLPLENWDESTSTVQTPHGQQTTTFQSPQPTYSTQQQTYPSNEAPIYCAECGSVNDSETVYCSTCGIELKR